MERIGQLGKWLGSLAWRWTYPRIRPGARRGSVRGKGGPAHHHYPLATDFPTPNFSLEAETGATGRRAWRARDDGGLTLRATNDYCSYQTGTQSKLTAPAIGATEELVGKRV